MPAPLLRLSRRLGKTARPGVWSVTAESYRQGDSTATAQQTVSCRASTGLTGTPTTDGRWGIAFTGGWSCTVPTAMSGGTTLDYVTLQAPYANGPVFSRIAPSSESSGGVESAPPGTWSSEFLGSVRLPAGQVWTYMDPGCTGLGTTLMTCNLIYFAELTP